MARHPSAVEMLVGINEFGSIGSDCLLLTKIDLVDKEALPRLANRRSTISPAAEQLQVRHGGLFQYFQLAEEH